jgi:hypothetical protein
LKEQKKMVNKKIKNIKISLLIIAILQIFILTNMSVAESYIIREMNYGGSKKIIDSERIKDLGKVGLNLLIGFLSIKQIGVVSSAEIPQYKCCKEFKDGRPCENLDISKSNECKEALASTTCDFLNDCKLGCCYNTEAGSCATNTPKWECASGGEWSDKKDCTIPKCTPGCCVTGNEYKLVTKGICEKLTLSKNIPIDKIDFRANYLEPQCRFLTEQEGACIYQSGSKASCIRTTEVDCETNRHGQFSVGYLCSRPDLQDSLDVKCEKKKYIGCVTKSDGSNHKPGVYLFDSCGNYENIYGTKYADAVDGSDYVILSNDKENCKDPTEDVTKSSTCGKCDGLESICMINSESNRGEIAKGIKGKNGEEYVCGNLNCETTAKQENDRTPKKRKNGESWCLYDGAIGEGRDIVGSEHWKAECTKGKVTVSICPGGGMRNYLCEERVTYDVNDEAKKNPSSRASCVPNQASDCAGYNADPSTMGGKCDENAHCQLRNINIAEHFTFSICTPKYPDGFDLNPKDKDYVNQCNFASRTCAVIYEKKAKSSPLEGKLLGTKFECVLNCECETNSFAQKMTDLCNSMGDCGNKINYLGVGTDSSAPRGIKGKKLDSDGNEKGDDSDGLGKAPGIWSSSEYSNNVNPIPGETVNLQETDPFKPVGLQGDYDPVSGSEGSWRMFSKISGATGTLISSLWWAIPASGGASVGSLQTGAMMVKGSGATATGGGGGASLGAAFGGALVGAAIGASRLSTCKTIRKRRRRYESYDFCRRFGRSRSWISDYLWDFFIVVTSCRLDSFRYWRTNSYLGSIQRARRA